MKPPEISVVMPVYNAERYIAEAIDSILRQTFADFELIIINDGSTDDSRRIMLSFEDSRIRLIDNPRNERLIPSLNKGLRLAKGRYLARMDADDISMPTRLETQYAYLEAHQDVALVGSSAYILSEDQQERIEKIALSSDVIATELLFRNCFISTSMMGRTEILRTFQFHPDYLLAEDYFLFSRMSRQCQLAILEEPLVTYRRHASNITKRKAQQIRDFTKRVLHANLETLGIARLSEAQLQTHFDIFLKHADFDNVRDRINALHWIHALSRIRNLPICYNSVYYHAQLREAFRKYFRYSDICKAGLPALRFLRSPYLPNASMRIKLQYFFECLVSACRRDIATR